MIKSSHLKAVIAASIVLASSSIASAAPSTLDRAAANATQTSQIEPASADVAEEDAVNCAKSRKRLWVEGEGWLVRKVTTCH